MSQLADVFKVEWHEFKLLPPPNLPREHPRQHRHREPVPPDAGAAARSPYQTGEPGGD